MIAHTHPLNNKLPDISTTGDNNFKIQKVITGVWFNPCHTVLDALWVINVEAHAARGRMTNEPMKQGQQME